MSTLSDLATEIGVQLQILVASGLIVSLTNQSGSGASVDSTNLSGVCNHAARTVQRKLGRTIDDSDVDAVDFGVRVALLLMVSMYSCTLTQDGAAYAQGVHSELKEEAKSRRDALDLIEFADENFVDLDKRYPERVWDKSVTGDDEESGGEI